MLQVRIGQSWRAMVPELASGFRAQLTSPFDGARVIVDSPGSARLLSQEIAAIDGIAAGVEYLTLGRFTASLARDAGVAAELEAWRSPRLVTAVWESLDDVARHHRLLARFLAKPGRKLSASARFARLLRSYVEHAPQLAQRWLDGDDGEPPAHLAWQPELMRQVCESLGFHPLEHAQQLCETARRDSTPTWLFCVEDVPRASVPLVAATAPDTAWFVGGTPPWLDDVPHEVSRTGKPLRANPTVEVHGSHSRLRQAEVLRDELTRCFQEDPGLEPRDVRIVCPDPADWAGVLNDVFRGDTSHPGHLLRVAEVAPEVGGNLALDALDAALAMLDERATATQVVEFLLMPAISHRWGFAQHRDDLLELVSDAQIRWGLDAAHRSRYGLPNTEYNTWFRGIDALLTGVAMGSDIGPPGVAGVGTTTAGDLPLIGALSEVVSRLRALAHASRGALSVPQWCDLAATALDDLVGLGHDESWMERQAATALDRLARSHGDSAATFTRREFRRLLLADLPGRWHRPALGNGALHVVSPSEVRHVDAEVVAFIGIGDSVGRTQPDELPDALPDVRSRRLQLLLAHARAARKLIVVTGTRSERTGAEVEMPVAISWLARELGVEVEPRHHSPQPFNISAFAEPGSFDARSHRGAVRSAGREEAPMVVRRRAAMSLPVAPLPSRVTLGELRNALQHPHKAFLRSTLGIRWFDDPSLSDGVPLSLGGLDEWQVTDAFITGLLRHEAPHELFRRALARQVLPPAELGVGVADRIGVQAQQVADGAAALMTDRQRLVPISLQVAGTMLTGSVALHGDVMVRPSASRRPTPLLLPWLELLALAASGVPARAEVLRPKREGRFRSNSLAQPSPERATELLELYLAAMARATSRLFPVPWDAAYQLAGELRRGFFSTEEWTGRTFSRYPKWRADDLWRLFYDEPVTELISDAATDDDPAGDGASKLERWACAMYVPLLEHGGGW